MKQKGKCIQTFEQTTDIQSNYMKQKHQFFNIEIPILTNKQLGHNKISFPIPNFETLTQEIGKSIGLP